MKSTAFTAHIEPDENDRILTYQIEENGQFLSYNKVIDYWINNNTFRSFFSELIRDSKPAWYVWETPPITTRQINRPFEFVLVSIRPRPRHPDQYTFANYFNAVPNDNGVVAFENLGKDALLVVPSPLAASDDYSELSAFLQHAPDEQVHALWRVLGQHIRMQLGDRPIWISVAGGGVAWLHVRIDKRPKYYRYAPYCEKPDLT